MSKEIKNIFGKTYLSIFEHKIFYLIIGIIFIIIIYSKNYLLINYGEKIYYLFLSINIILLILFLCLIIIKNLLSKIILIEDKIIIILFKKIKNIEIKEINIKDIKKILIIKKGLLSKKFNFSKIIIQTSNEEIIFDYLKNPDIFLEILNKNNN